jgi:predicted small metal-binding protein
MKRLDEAECKIINLREAVSDLDIDSQVEDEINRRNILTEDNFSPSDYDLVSSDDYDFDSFITEDDSVGEQDVEKIVRDYLEDYHDAQEMDEAIKENIKDAQGELIESMVKKVCTEMLVDWCQRTAEAADKQQEETDSSSE